MRVAMFGILATLCVAILADPLVPEGFTLKNMPKTLNWNPILGTMGDESIGQVELPAFMKDFKLHGQHMFSTFEPMTAWVASNGVLYFKSPTSTHYDPCSFDTADDGCSDFGEGIDGSIGPVIAPFWGDLQTVSNVYYSVGENFVAFRWLAQMCCGNGNYDAGIMSSFQDEPQLLIELFMFADSRIGFHIIELGDFDDHADANNIVAHGSYAYVGTRFSADYYDQYFASEEFLYREAPEFALIYLPYGTEYSSSVWYDFGCLAMDGGADGVCAQCAPGYLLRDDNTCISASGLAISPMPGCDVYNATTVSNATRSCSLCQKGSILKEGGVCFSYLGSFPTPGFNPIRDCQVYTAGTNSTANAACAKCRPGTKLVNGECIAPILLTVDDNGGLTCDNLREWTDYSGAYTERAMMANCLKWEYKDFFFQGWGCTKCATGFVPREDGMCVAVAAWTGWTPIGNCSAYTQATTSAANRNCSACADGFIKKVNNVCLPTATISGWEDISDCDVYAAVTTTNANKLCSVCKMGYGLTSAKTACNQDITGCKTYAAPVGDNAATCSACWPGSVLSYDGTTCYDVPPGPAYDGWRRCLQFLPWSGDMSEEPICWKCPTGYVNRDGSGCIPTSIISGFTAVTNCTSYSFASTTNANKNCTECAPGSILKTGNACAYLPTLYDTPPIDNCLAYSTSTTNSENAKCVQCKGEYGVSSDGLSCLNDVPNCVAYNADGCTKCYGQP